MSQEPVGVTATPVPGVPVVQGVQISFDEEPSRRSREYGGPAVVCVLHEHSGRHPPGVPPGGRWIEMGYFGPSSALCCCLSILLCWPVALCIPLCPCDSKVVYQAPDGILYDGGPDSF